ncbi:MAG: helix-hairpin-helix domain-containing protein [Prolixibacteraceae bacterium]|jgi:hypothetical protein|nr:helix-hairpin-helix domain-containing protein [Prolixibacteraceae bacterium]
MFSPTKQTVVVLLLVNLSAIGFNKHSLAQTTNNNGRDIIERISESYIETLDDDADLNSILEDLIHFKNNPFNINTAKQTDLEKLHFLTTIQIDNLLAYIRTYGQLYSSYELLAIDGFDAQTTADIDAFVSFLPPDTQEKAYWHHTIDSRYRQTIETKAGFVKNEEGQSKFLGIKPAVLLKYKGGKGNKLEYALTAETDEGEEFFGGSNAKGFDFYAAYFAIKFNSVLKEVIIGDYQVKSGLGLVSWSGFGKRKSIQGVNIRPMGQGIRGYSSTNENSFYRGAALHFEKGDFNLITYYSYNPVDATISKTDSSGNALQVSALQQSGYHRTASELANRNSLNVQTTGAHLKYNINRFSAGINTIYQLFDLPLQQNPKPYNRYYFTGTKNYNISTNFLWTFNRINFFGEAGISRSKGKSVLAGIEAQPSNDMSFSILYRNYAPDFHTINGQAFSETSGNRNEEGFYAGWSILPFFNTKITGYADFYRTPWLRYTSASPAWGCDLSLQTTYTPAQNFELYIRLKHEANTEKSSQKALIRYDSERTIQRLRINAQWDINQYLSIKGRTEFSRYIKDGNSENGLLVFTDVTAKPGQKFKVAARFSWFNTKSYNSRIYAYENDVLHYFYIPAFYSNGLRYYINMSYAISSRIKIYLKLSQSYYLDDSFAIGSGTSHIEGNKKTDFKFHIRYRL